MKVIFSLQVIVSVQIHVSNDAVAICQLPSESICSSSFKMLSISLFHLLFPLIHLGKGSGEGSGERPCGYSVVVLVHYKVIEKSLHFFTAQSAQKEREVIFSSQI